MLYLFVDCNAEECGIKNVSKRIQYYTILCKLLTDCSHIRMRCEYVCVCVHELNTYIKCSRSNTHTHGLVQYVHTSMHTCTHIREKGEANEKKTTCIVNYVMAYRSKHLAHHLQLHLKFSLTYVYVCMCVRVCVLASLTSVCLLGWLIIFVCLFVCSLVCLLMYVCLCWVCMTDTFKTIDGILRCESTSSKIIHAAQTNTIEWRPIPKTILLYTHTHRHTFCGQFPNKSKWW